MPRRDYYVILGVSPTENETGIREAFRDLVRRYHPDRAGPHATPLFQQVVEAYQVLSDQERRASYDRGLHHAAADDEDEQAPEVTTIAPRPGRRQAEAMVPAPVSVMRDFHVTRPSHEEVLARFRSNFVSHQRAPQGLDALRLEVVIGPDQAAAGGTLTLGVPVFFPCLRCRGLGSVGPYRCAECHGSGQLEEERPARVFIPPMVRDGTTFQLPLVGLGIRNLYLEVRIRVAG